MWDFESKDLQEKISALVRVMALMFRLDDVSRGNDLRSVFHSVPQQRTADVTLT